MSARFPVNVDYTPRDKRSILLRLQGLVRSVFPKWTDFNRAGFDNILLESFAYVGDILAFYQDGQAQELFWPTVTQRTNAIRLGRHISYQMPSAIPATSTARFFLPSNTAVDVPIPLGTIVRTPSPSSIPFRTITPPDHPTTPATIFAGSSYVDVAIEQAEQVLGENYPATGAPNQRLQLIQAPYIDDTAVVTAADGEYAQIDSFLDIDPNTGTAIGPDSRVYAVLSDPFDRAIILFGNGKAGKIPQGSISVDYKIGGGAAGNVDADSITILDSTILNVLSQVSPVRVTNPVAASGGVNRTSVVQARVLGPRSLRVLERCVTKEDFELTAMSVPGVVRACMLTSNESPTVPENTGVLLVVAAGTRLPSGSIVPAIPSTTLLHQVYQKVTVEKPHTLTFTLSTTAVSLRTIDISTRVYLAAGYVAADVGNTIRAALADYFAVLLPDGTENPAIDFGANIKQADGSTIAEIAWSDIFNVVNDAQGVRKVDEGSQGLLLSTLRKSITLGVRDFPILGTVQIIDADTGSAI